MSQSHSDRILKGPGPDHSHECLPTLETQDSGFFAPTGDHYVTRLTHTLEVAQIGRTIARALNLYEDLVEAMAHGHNLGTLPSVMSAKIP